MYGLLYVDIAIKNNGGSTFVSWKDGDALISFEGGHSPSLQGVIRADEFFWPICPATMMRTSERTSSGMVGWDKIDSRFPTKLTVSASAMLNFIPRSG